MALDIRGRDQPGESDREVRRALNDDAAKPRFVRTIHRLGIDSSGKWTSRARLVKDPQQQVQLVWELRQVPLTEGSNVVGRGTDNSIWIDALACRAITRAS